MYTIPSRCIKPVIRCAHQTFRRLWQFLDGISIGHKYSGPEVIFSQPAFNKVNPHLLLDNHSTFKTFIKWIEFSSNDSFA